MENNFFILGKVDSDSEKSLKIKRLQLCSWDIISQNSYLEIGIEIESGLIANNADYCIYFFAPWLNEKCKCQSLHENFADPNNCKFIFNEVVESCSPIDGDKHNGTVITFVDDSRTSLAVLRSDCSIIKESKYLKITLKNKTNEKQSPYIRVLITTPEKTLAIIKDGIAKKEFIFDIKINEKRNLPEDVLNIKSKQDLDFAHIDTVFCFHAVPTSYDIGFIDSKLLKNVRKLESDAFAQYLPEVKNIKEGNSIITFSKESQKESYAFFTIFTQETIGSTQVIFAIATNIICSLLFAFESLRRNVTNLYENQNTSSALIDNIPFEYWLAIVLLLTCVVYFFLPEKIKRLLEKIKRYFFSSPH